MNTLQTSHRKNVPDLMIYKIRAGFFQVFQADKHFDNLHMQIKATVQHEHP